MGHACATKCKNAEMPKYEKEKLQKHCNAINKSGCLATDGGLVLVGAIGGKVILVESYWFMLMVRIHD